MTLSQIFNRLFVCKGSNHELSSSGSCPFTGNTYYHCSKCGFMTFEKTVGSHI
jgi:transcription elongation factor Elf1